MSFCPEEYVFCIRCIQPQSVTEEGWMLCTASLSVILFFVLHSLLKCSNKLSSTSLCIILNGSVFMGGKREVSSIAGVDSPYHSVQVAAVTRLFFVRRAILKLLVR